ncbi:hypothetical protein AM10699_19210 [Acaryochloris marina MBIC10699]|nr:hypothetical protein AM10699_19210 [Acaryochloris marina MBIC10699]
MATVGEGVVVDVGEAVEAVVEAVVGAAGEVKFLAILQTARQKDQELDPPLTAWECSERERHQWAKTASFW